MMLNIRAILLSCALLASGLAIAQNGAGTDAMPPLDESQQAAKALLMNMATQLGEAKKFQVDVLVGYDTMQADGQKIEFGEKRRLSLERPSLLLSEEQNSNGVGEAILFDGEWITVSDSAAGVYARAAQPGDIDVSIKYFLSDLHMRLPLAIMLKTDFAQEIDKRLLDIAYVEETDILGEPTDHLAGRTKDVDFQVWITKDAQALPLRIVLTYRELPGQPQFRANFSQWNFNPSFLQKTFRFEPPVNAHEVPLVAAFTAANPAPDAGSEEAAPSSTGEEP
jgi:hypothetical protein